ncbi:MAG: hypothetical protein JSS57_07420 [Proteobacteria bacterium]|nr:hypothetical protein [Pseudomonadota bacterium]
MADIALIVDGKVVQVWRDHSMQTVRSEVGTAPTLVQAQPGTVACAMLWDGHSFSSPPPTPAPVPDQISPRQFMQALKGAGLISAEEAVAWATANTLPSQIEAMISAMPTEHQSDARITIARMTVVERGDPLVEMLAASQDMDDAAVDNLFRAAAAL